MGLFKCSNQWSKYYRTALLGGNTVAVLSLCSVPALADAKMNGLEITAFLSDVKLSARDAEGRLSEQVFRKSGATFTVDLTTHQQSQGSWKVEGDQYCSVWPPSSYWTCYDVHRVNDGVDFVSSSGSHYVMTKTLSLAP
jgi:hypothetical protein